MTYGDFASKIWILLLKTKGKKNMPKALPGVRSTIMEASRKQLLEGGYGAMTLRSVAAECGISIGTIYHYFSSKDELILTLVNEKWLNTLSALSEKCITAASARDAIQWVYDELSAFFVFLSRILNDLPAGSYELFSPNNHRAKKQEQLMRLLQPVTDRFARVQVCCRGNLHACKLCEQASRPFKEDRALLM